MNWNPGWYLVRCQQHGWKQTLKSLNGVGVKTCCPVLYKQKKRKDRENAFRLSEHQVFPGYVFVKFDPKITHTSIIKRVPGVMNFVQFGLQTHPIKEEVIETLQQASVLHADQSSYECINISKEKLEKAIEIYQTETPEKRVSKLLELVTDAQEV